MFTAVSISINFIAAFAIIFFELSNNPEFRKWFNDSGTLAVPFLILARADIEVLVVLSSEFAGLEFFKAPIREETKKIIFWLGFLGIFIEDTSRKTRCFAPGLIS